MTALPLISGFEPDAVFARHSERSTTAAEYLGDVAALAALLPDQPHVINLCQDRYRFAVGLGAALVQRQVTLLPPNATPGLLAELATSYPHAYALTDCDLSHERLKVLRFPELNRTGSSSVPAFPADQPAAILFTSGSTGTPRPFARDWGAMVASATAAGHSLLNDALSSATIVATVPHQHSYGIESTVMLGLHHGLALDSGRPLLPADVCARLEGVPRPRLLVTAPIHLKALLAQSDTLPPVDLILSATAPLSPQLAREAEERFAAPLQEIYGCSEAGQLATRRTALGQEWTCLAGVALRQDDRGTWASGTPVGPEQLLNDVIELLSPTRFLLHGRTADLINVAGKRSSLAHLNYQLNAIPGVVDGAFLMPDEASHANARLMAFAVAPGMSLQSIVAQLRQNLDPAFLPRPLIMVDSLPRNALGKLPREALLALAADVART